jgi:hypothetical protein
LGWSLQRPTRQARERDEAAIARWKRERWPQVKKMGMGRGPTLRDENGLSSRRAARSETSTRVGTASPQKN